MEEALHDIPLYREFAMLGAGMTRLPDESTILRFRHLLEAHELSARMLATINEILQTKGLMPLPMRAMWESRSGAKRVRSSGTSR
jgi:IS5 family transposase